MKIEEIRELVRVLEDSSLNLIEIEEGDSRVLLSKTGTPGAAGGSTAGVRIAGTGAAENAALPVAGGMSGNGGLQSTGAMQAAQGMQAAGGLRGAEAIPASWTPVKAPMIGVFYAAPSPDEKPFVAVGQTVQKGQVLCILEAMKLMNEITAEQDGVVAKICVQDGDVVEYGQPILYLE